MECVKPVASQLIGRFGNQLFQYCHARAYSELMHRGLRLPAWVGEQIFDLPVTERPDETCEVLGGYRQSQNDLIYTRAQVREWLRLKPAIESYLHRYWGRPLEVAAHIRRGDYQGYGYPLVSLVSYCDACEQHGLDGYTPITEETPAPSFGLPPFLADFYRMMKAKMLLRANSSFSWWAATLGDGKVYSPVIDGLEGGKEHECKFVEGNWPRLSNLDGCTDLHL